MDKVGKTMVSSGLISGGGTRIFDGTHTISDGHVSMYGSGNLSDMYGGGSLSWSNGTPTINEVKTALDCLSRLYQAMLSGELVSK